MSNSRYIYLDTNAFRYFGKAFAADTLSDDLRQRILISPLSAFELFAQLAREECQDDVLQQINSLRNWIDPSHCGLLPWPDSWLYHIWHHEPKPADDFTEKMQDAFNWIMAVESAESLAALKEVAAEHEKLMNDFKWQKAEEFKAMIDGAKQESLKGLDTTHVWFESIAKSVGADPSSKPMAEIVSALSAHHEFEQAKLETALSIPDYNPLSRKNQNDSIDAEQLVYLFDESLFMLTSDSGFKRKVTKSKQAARILTAPATDLMDAKKAELTLRTVLT